MFPGQLKTSIFSLRKERWIQGPHLPEELDPTSGCVLAVNYTSVLFVMPLSVIGFDFEANKWSKISNSGHFFNMSACAMIQDKNYKR